MSKIITVFTPTYNRANLLPRLYNSLINQNSNKLIWLVVDDGSTDNTEQLVKSWQEENKIPISYIKKTNGGLHTGYNVAIENINTELAVCVDSDDYMPTDAIQKILTHWKTYGNENYAGIIGLDFLESNQPIGSLLPNKKSVHFIEVKTKYKSVGDTKMVHRTELLKKFVPMPTFNNEKNFNPSYIFLQVDKTKPLLILNENLCYVDYQVDGMTFNIYNQFRNSPNSFLEMRKLYLSLQNTAMTFKIKTIVHYISSCIFAKRYKDIFTTPHFLLKVALIPVGIILNLYIRYKTD